MFLYGHIPTGAHRAGEAGVNGRQAMEWSECESLGTRSLELMRFAPYLVASIYKASAMFEFRRLHCEYTELHAPSPAQCAPDSKDPH